MSEPQVYRSHPDVVAEVVGNELLLVQLSQGTTFRLNRTGRAVWDQLVSGLSVNEVIDRVHSESGTSTEFLKQDVSKLLKDLVENSLLEPQPKRAQ